VLGHGVVQTEPDAGELWIRLSDVQPSPGPALADVARRSQALDRLLDELGIAAPARSSSGVGVAEEFEHTADGRRSLGHRATSTLVVRLTDVALIGALIMRAGDELDATIGGPTWSVSPGHPAYEEAAKRAAADAAAKAAAYASGVGMRRGELLRLAEPPEIRFATPLARAASTGPDMPVSSGEHAVTAAVWATFALVGG
jgi:uncharacterized protein YggE